MVWDGEEVHKYLDRIYYNYLHNWLSDVTSQPTNKLTDYREKSPSW